MMTDYFLKTFYFVLKVVYALAVRLILILNNNCPLENIEHVFIKGVNQYKEIVELLIEFRTSIQNIIFLLAIITMVVTETRRKEMEIDC